MIEPARDAIISEQHERPTQERADHRQHLDIAHAEAFS
jgi:hypothetical protein